MKAVVFSEYGSPDVLQFKEVEKPTPKDNEVLVKVIAASANPLDWHRMRGAPFIARLEEGWRKPQNPKFGADIAGRVVAVGKNVSQFRPGDDVFGDVYAGGFAEYAIATPDNLVLKPANVSYIDAAAVPVAGLTALQGLRDAGQIQAGETVLINGASGGVGTYAVQITKAYGAEVTGVCSSRNQELVRSIGADYTIDYTQTDFTKTGTKYDLVFDMVGNRTMRDLKNALNPKGRCVVGGFTSLSLLFPVLLLSRFASLGGKKIGMMPTAHTNQPDLKTLGELLASGKVKSVIDRCYPLSETAEAIRYLETGRARGKVIINVEQTL